MNHKMISLTSAFTGCPIGFVEKTSGQDVLSWRVVTRYRSVTIADSHGIARFYKCGHRVLSKTRHQSQRTADKLMKPVVISKHYIFVSVCVDA
jgi:hypothetical protein